MPPLNPSLYQILHRSFGHVRIVEEGCAMVRRYEADADGSSRLIADCAGEYYLVNCPFCGDRRHRLWINHRWGLRDPKTKTRNLWLAICYNENCLADPRNLNELVRRTTWYGRLDRACRVRVAEGVTPPSSRAPDLPADFVCLSRLTQDHPAIEYVRRRGFDSAELAERWSVGFSREACPWSPGG